ncbi:MAG: AEC family transporter, partial [Arcobacteraceae bacterium]|nr:AEC family transporter [Arcobacteraceae bacterium]
VISKYLFKESKEQSIFIATSLIGNTGNLGIPLGIALFGEASIAYTSIINIANIFFIYTVGIYLFAKESFTFKQSLLSMVKIPILWFAIIALLFNYNNFKININIDNALQMGAYSAIVIQLIIFGIYLAKVNLKEQNYLLSISTSTIKLVILPIMGIIFSIMFNLEPSIASILIVSLSTPLAVNNVNIAALFNCKPYAVTNIVFISTLLFLIIFYFDLQIINMVFK